MGLSARLVRVTTTLTLPLLLAACGSTMSPAPPAPSPLPAPQVTANVYILPGAIALGRNAFGDEDIVIFTGERMRWRNVDGVEHTIVADSPALPEFMTTGPLQPDGEISFDMFTVGTTRVHCKDHPQMTGTIVVKNK
jgi:plastocyanin